MKHNTVFEITHKDTKTKARIGTLHTKHGDVQTPVFLPIGTKASVKGLSNDELIAMDTEMILANTYHLWVSPGDELVRDAFGLHKFMNWDKAIFTDSGGYQLFSLGEKLINKFDRSHDRDTNRSSTEQLPFSIKISEEGVSFQSGSNGNTMMLTPEKSVSIQHNLGSDVAVVLDEFTGDIFNHDKVKATIERTTRWAKRSKDEWERLQSKNSTTNTSSYVPHSSVLIPYLLGIVQGGMIPELREQSACEIRNIGFDGYAIGGVAVGGESADEQYKAVDMSLPYLEEDKYKHLLGVGTPEQIIQGVARGIDSFDCVVPTREARHGRLYIHKKGNAKLGEYDIIDIKKAEFKIDFTSLDSKCICYGCLNHTKAYIHHLIRSGELLGMRLTTLHNVQFYLDLMKDIRNSIINSTFNKK